MTHSFCDETHVYCLSFDTAGSPFYEHVSYDEDEHLTWVALVDHDRGIKLAFVVRNLQSLNPEIINLYPVKENQ